MNEDDECIHIPGVPKSQCTICNGKEEIERLRTSQIKAQFPAHFAGRLRCGHQADVGDQITLLHDGWTMCEECSP